MYIFTMAFICPGTISIHSPHAGRYQRYRRNTGKMISIHSPRAGRDYYNFMQILRTTHISIHSPHAGRYLAEAFGLV